MFVLKNNDQSTKAEPCDCIEDSIKILHLGDLHANDTGLDEKILSSLIKYLRHDKEENGPSTFAILSGDIVNRGPQPNKFDDVSKFVSDLRIATELRKNQIVIVPGWHDILSTEPHFGPFLEFTNEFYDWMPPISNYATSANIFREFVFGRLWGYFPLIVLALNSCDPLDHKKLSVKSILTKKKEKTEMNSGKISKTQVENILATVGEEEIANSFVIVVCHHTKWPDTAAQYSSDADRGARLFNHVSNLHPSLILTGHYHYCTPVDLINNTNTLSCSSGRICNKDDPKSNQFNILELSVFAHQKDVFATKQRVLQWKGTNWVKKDPIFRYTNGVSEEIKEYFESKR